MKYGIVVNGRVTEPVSVPNPLPPWAQNDAQWLAKQFPTLVGQTWVQVSEDCVPGATYNGPGNTTNPATYVPPPQYVKLDRGARLEIISDVFADARVNAIHDAFAALTTDVMKVAYRKFMSDTYKASRAELIALFTALRNADVPTAGTKITVAEITAIADHPKWIAG